MNSKKPILIIIALFVALMVGATALYHNLGATAMPDRLATQSPATESTEAPALTESTEPAAAESTEPVATETPGQTEPAEVPDETQPKPQQLPDFTVYDLEGNPVTLHEYFGKPIVLNFWASRCGPCRSEMPGFNKQYLELGDEIQFLMINMTGGREILSNATSYLAEQGFEFPVFFDLDLDAAITYGVSSLPMTLFIDRDGYLVAYTPKSITEETLLRGIDLIR